MKTIATFLAPAAGFALLCGGELFADTFGTGGNQFSIDFVEVGNPGNPNDTGGGGGSFHSVYGGVAYVYRMGEREVSQQMIEKATASGLQNVSAGAWSGTRPAADISWLEAAAFVNWLNVTTGHQAAYDLAWTGSAWTMNLWESGQAWQQGGQNLYRHKDAFYFLPSENEWYKAAFHKNDGATGNYWDYPTQENWPDVPDGITFQYDPNFEEVFNSGFKQGAPNGIENCGTGRSAYGTAGQGGNLQEWTESAHDGNNDSATKARRLRGAYYDQDEALLRSSARDYSYNPTTQRTTITFRIASIPEPSSAGLLLTAACALALRAFRRRK